MNIKRKFPLNLIAICLLAALLLAGCQSEDGSAGNISGFLSGNDEIVTEPATDPTDPPTEPTEPPPTCPPDGNPDDVTAQGSYTGTAMEVVQNDDVVVATIGKEELTNALLQIYYQMAVGAYQEAGHEIAPDFTQSLDTQLFPGLFYMGF